MTFVELDRDFLRIDKDEELELDFDSWRRWRHSVEGWLLWHDLLEYRRVILLAEASSGKTEEFKNKAKTLRQSGETAFFVPIEQLAEIGFEKALPIVEVNSFKDWRASTDDGYFFLDSIDEARLNRKSFTTALQRFAGELDVSLGRARIFVSCRVSDWEGDADRRSIAERLPVPTVLPPANATDDHDSALLGPIFDSGAKRPASNGPKDETKENELLVVKLVPLTNEQRAKLARGSDVTDTEEFLKAIESAGLDALADRPGDLLELAAYWNSYHRFGTLAVMIENAVTHKLEELRKFRADNDVLSDQKARVGAERVAAALTLGKSFTVRTPGHMSGATNADGPLDVSAILDDWTDGERNALLRRGIFAPATYGRVRFHHRSTQEYLAGMWFHRLLVGGCPENAIWNLIFAEKYGVETVVPSLQPAAAWLALRHDEIASEIVRREPLILIRFGDPGSLSLTTRKNLLRSYAIKHLSGDLKDEMLEHRSLWMFAHSELADAIREAWELNNKPDFRAELLRLIREGSIRSCVDLARQVALDESANDYHRIIAVAAMKASDDRQGMKTVARHLLATPEAPSPLCVAEFAKILFPNFMSVQQLLALIRASTTPHGDTTSGFGDVIGDLWRNCPDNEAKNELAAGLAEICLRTPYVESYHRVSKKHAKLARYIEPVARTALLELGKTTPPDPLIRLLMVVERAERNGWPDDTPPLESLVRTNSSVNRALFWSDVEDERRHRAKKDELTHPWQIHFLNGSLWQLTSNDVDWLFDDLWNRTCESDRRIALHAVLSILDRNNELQAKLPAIRKVIADNKQLAEDLDVYLSPPKGSEESRSLAETSQQITRQREEMRAKDESSWIEFRDEVRADPATLTDPELLSEWAGVLPLFNLTKWLARKTSTDMKVAPLNWDLLAEAFGRQVAQAYRAGMKALWRVTLPKRPKHHKDGRTTTKWATVLAYAGLALESKDNSTWAKHLTTKEAELAALHGCITEQGFPDWIDDLLDNAPASVLPIVRRVFEKEWQSRHEGSRPFLYHYTVQSYSLHPAIEEMFLDIFFSRPPGSIGSLTYGLQILHRINRSVAQDRRLSAVASRRFSQALRDNNRDRAVRYLALMFLVDVPAVTVLLIGWVRKNNRRQRRELTEYLFASLFGRSEALVPLPLTNVSVDVLEKLVLFAYEEIRLDDDNVHDGPYESDQRDKAEGSRGSLLKALIDTPGEESHAAMIRLASHRVLKPISSRLGEFAREMAVRDAEISAWHANEILMFERQFLAPIKTGDDLFRVILSTIDDITYSFVHADASSRRVLETAADEDAVQEWLAEQMRQRAKGRFHVHREVQVAGAKEPDVVVSSASSLVEVAVEVKHGGKPWWPVKKLERALSYQLAENYLKPQNRQHGVFVITHHGKRTWRHPVSKKVMNFSELIDYLTDIASDLKRNCVGLIELAVRGIDASAQGRKGK